jgi:hypothetical protein
MRIANVPVKIKLLVLTAVCSVGISAKVGDAPCEFSKWMIEARLVDSKVAANNAQIMFTFVNPEFGLGIQTIDIAYGKVKRQIKSDTQGKFQLAMKPGKYQFVIKQFKCAPLKQNIEIKNKERISIKVNFIKADPSGKCG